MRCRARSRKSEEIAKYEEVETAVDGRLSNDVS